MLPRIRRRGLRAKIIAWFLVPTIIILSAVALLTFYAYQRVTEELVFERNQDQTRLLATQLTAELQEYVGRLNALTATPEIYEHDPTVQQATLRQGWTPSSLQVFDGGVLILDRDGRVVAAEPQRPELLGQDFSTRAYFNQALCSPQPAFSDILADGIGGAEVVALAVPILGGQDEFRGMMVGMFRAERGATRSSAFYNSIWELYIGRQKVAYLVDSHSRVIFHSDTFLIGKDLATQEAVQQVLGRQVDSIRTRNLEDQEVVASFAPVPGTCWGLVTEESWATLIGASQRYGWFLLLLLVLSVTVPAGVIAWGGRRITDPIAELSGAAQEVAGGNLDQRIAVRTGDELEDLAGHFNRMATQLRDSYAQLERKVADRTRELATLNAVAAVVSRSLELQDILQGALDKTLEAMDIEAGGAFRLEGKRQVLTLVAHRGLSAGFVHQIEQLPLQISITGQAASRGEPIVRQVTDYSEGELQELMEKEGLRLVVSIPLVVKEKTLGILNLAARTPRVVTPEEMAMLASIGQQTGLAVENACLYEQAEQSAAVAERNRLARELHDAVSQTLFSASLIAEVLPRLWERNPDEGRRRLDEVRQLTRGALAEMRTLLLELRPKALLKADLGELMRQLAEAVNARARVPVTVTVEGKCVPPSDVKVALYRIAQEALNNVTKHANASQAKLRLCCEPARVKLQVSDDGCGFDLDSVPPGHLGLGIIRERAEAIGARLTVESKPGCGTQIAAVWTAVPS